MGTQTVKSDSLNTKLLLKTLLAFKKGDFSARLPGDWTGEAGKIADTFNDIIELSDRTAKELERVSRVVGKEGKIMHRAAVPHHETDAHLQILSSCFFAHSSRTARTVVGRLISGGTKSWGQ